MPVSHPTARTTVLAAALGLSALAGCTPHQRHGDVVLSTESSRAGGVQQHYAACASSTLADRGNYRVPISQRLADQLTEGQPCPTGTALPMPQDENHELYREMSDALYAPAPFAGGDLATCGEWEADAPEDARYMLSQCPPLTRGELP